MDYQLYTVRLFSFRWDESVTFYRDTVGLPLTFENAGMGWAQFDLGGASLAVERCAPDDPEAASLVGRFAATSIRVPDIQTSYQTLSDRGVRFLGPPEQQPWGGTLAHLEDPDGNVITLLETPQTEADRRERP